ncbi:RNA polymerase sigma factor [Micromonospora sp. CB01531]|uniref:RNA polymerase sigma factor n=1 Tax=Micromonospora sp. CB01531 TaxID=1718947 RepID=UPI0009FB2EFC|nr:SigE family RNA polymerase sigma factor [Micromonospora sp. CB01531]
MAVGTEVAEPVSLGEDGFRTVYEEQFPLLVRFAYLTTGSAAAAEDLVQETFVELYRHRDRVRAPVPWLRRAVANRCTSWVRRRVLERRHAFRDPDPPYAPTSADGPAVRAALRQVRPRQRAALFLRYYLDLPEREIAEALGCAPGTVKALLHRGLATLKGPRSCLPAGMSAQEWARVWV